MAIRFVSSSWPAPEACGIGGETLRRRRIAIRRLDAQQMADEEVLETPPAVGRAGNAIPRAGNDQQVEVLARLDERVDYLHRARRVHVVVQFPDHQKQLAR